MTIQLENICKSVAGQKVLENVNWEIGSDDCFLLTGPEGSGKTMLLRLILGLEKPDSGSVKVVFQEDRLCEQFSAIENVAMVNERLSAMVAEEELVKFLPSDRLSLPVSALTPLERRLVVMIRACIIPSDILLLDEVLRGMDDALRKKVVSYIRDKAGHKGIVFVQRDDKGLEFCRRFALEG